MFVGGVQTNRSMSSSIPDPVASEGESSTWYRKWPYHVKTEAARYQVGMRAMGYHVGTEAKRDSVHSRHQ